MAFPAAAIMGTQRGMRGSLPARYGNPLREKGPLSGPNIAAALAAVVSVVLISVGLSSLSSSRQDTRGALVQDYDRRVVSWDSSERALFASLEFNVTARWTAAGAGEGNCSNASLASRCGSTSVLLEQVQTLEKPFHDEERGQGLLHYKPLKFLSLITFAGYYPASELQRAPQPGVARRRRTRERPTLPPRDGAAHVTFTFSVRQGSHGNWNTFSTEALPMAYSEVGPPRNPSPEATCRADQGEWPASSLGGSSYRERQCLAVHRLERICVQVHAEANGTWILNRMVSDSAVPTTSQRPLSTRHRGRYRAQSHTPPAESYGCDPKDGWSPHFYGYDSCWGHEISERCPLTGRRQHKVSVMVRNANDPFLRAEDLTHGSMNFGLSPASQRVDGIALLVVGLIICIIPIARCCCRVKGRGADSEEQRSFSSAREDPRNEPQQETQPQDQQQEIPARAQVYGVGRDEEAL